MDSCTFKSITGLDNYYGFKSLLKNSRRFNIYGCDDDTIVFNSLKTISLTEAAATGLVLSSNQVFVVVSSMGSTSYWYDAPMNIGYQNTFVTKNVNNDWFYFNLTDNGLVVGCDLISGVRYTMNPDMTLTFAVFNLY